MNDFVVCRLCGSPQDIACACPDGPAQEPNPCPIHGPHEGMMLWDGRSKYGFPIGGRMTFCVPCAEARRAIEAVES